LTRRFKQQKGNALRKLNKAKSENLVDTFVIPLLDYINSLENFYTTSSCSGRISVFCDVGSKREDFAAGKWHRKVELGEVMDAINSSPCSGIVWFRQESSIFHIVSRDLKGAEKLLNIALKGYKYSGIPVLKEERFMVEVLSTERVDAPVMDNKKLIVDEYYIKFLIELANRKFEQGQEKLKKFEKEIRDNLK